MNNLHKSSRYGFGADRYEQQIHPEALLFNLPNPSPELTVILSMMANASENIRAWIDFRRTLQGKRKSAEEKIGRLWTSAVISWCWLHGLPSRITFADCCRMIDIEEQKCCELIVGQFDESRTKSIRGPEAVAWLQQEFVPDSMKGPRTTRSKSVASSEYARRALQRQAVENFDWNI